MCVAWASVLLVALSPKDSCDAKNLCVVPIRLRDSSNLTFFISPGQYFSDCTRGIMPIFSVEYLKQAFLKLTVYEKDEKNVQNVSIFMMYYKIQSAKSFWHKDIPQYYITSLKHGRIFFSFSITACKKLITTENKQHNKF